MRPSVLSVLLAALTTSACDAAVATQATPSQADAPVLAVDAQIKPDELDLESINYLVKKGKVKDAEALEKAINNPKEKLHSIDLDGDGKLDKIQIVEVKKPNDELVFELHIIPSGKGKDADVVVAVIDFVPDKGSGQMVVKATYTPIVVGYDTIVYDYTVPIVVKGETIVVDGGPAFFGWLYSVRPVYVGVVVVDVAPPVIIKHKHKHKHKGKWKGKGKHKWHWH